MAARTKWKDAWTELEEKIQKTIGESSSSKERIVFLKDMQGVMREVKKHNTIRYTKPKNSKRKKGMAEKLLDFLGM